jgi:hypothetical protein
LIRPVIPQREDVGGHVQIPEFVQHRIDPAPVVGMHRDRRPVGRQIPEITDFHIDLMRLPGALRARPGELRRNADRAEQGGVRARAAACGQRAPEGLAQPGREPVESSLCRFAVEVAGVLQAGCLPEYAGFVQCPQHRRPVRLVLHGRS